MITPPISVVICAYTASRLGQLLEAMQSVAQQLRGGDELIVVIDHNEDLRRQVASWSTPARVIANDGPKGLSGARNSGITAATGAITAFLDDDGIAAPDWLETLRAVFEDRIVIGAGGPVIPRWPDAPQSWLPQPFLWTIGCSHQEHGSGRQPIRNPIGCNMAFRSWALKASGGFETGLGRSDDNAAGAEETELSLRLAELFPRMAIVHDASVRVTHQIDPSRVNWKYFARRCLAEGKSKAILSRQHRATRPLATERSYVSYTLPAYVGRSFLSMLRNRDLQSGIRAANVFAGLGLAAIGYFWERLRRIPGAGPEFAPFKIADIDIDALPEAIDLSDSGRSAPRGLFALVRRGGRLLGTIELPAAAATINKDVLRSAIDARLPDTCLEQSTLSPPTELASIVVATRDRPESLGRCLDSLLAQSHPDFEIVVVDNAPSSEATREYVISRYGSELRVRYCREPVPGLARAHNRGVAETRGRFIAFTDDDVIADRNWLLSLIAAFGAGNKVGCVTGLILPAELETRAQVWTERHGGFGKGFDRRLFNLDQHRGPGTLYPLTAGQFGSGANMAFSAEALRSIGGFDGALGAGTFARGGDDLDGFHRIVTGGYQLVYEPDALVWHHHRRGEEGMSRQAFGYGMGLGAYVCAQIVKNPALATWLALRLPHALHHILAGSSGKNARLPSDYPSMLRWRERLGIVLGFPAYVISRRRNGKQA